MSKSGSTSAVRPQGDALAVKRSQFVQQPAAPRKRGVAPWLVALPIVLAVLVAGIFVVVGQQGAAAPAAAQAQGQTAALPAAQVQGHVGGINSAAANKKYPLVLADANGELRFPTASLADGQARFFSTTLPDGKAISFFLIKSSDGVIRAAIDSCDVCYAARKGYHQEGDVVVCNNCGQRFASTKINEVKGGCNPVALTRAVQGDTVVITLADLQSGNHAENGQPLF